MESFANLIRKLDERHAVLSKKRICVGFDGYIDKLYRVVSSRSDSNKFSLFKTIDEFANRVGKASKKSADIEILLQEIRYGGNAPLTANCLASLDCPTKCIGLLGEPLVHEAFGVLHSNCYPISIGSPCQTIAFEFEDGKLMFGEQSHMQMLNWELLKQSIGLEKLTNIFMESDLIGIFNWSSAVQMNGMLHEIISEILPKMEKEKIIFFDVSDPSSRSRLDIDELLLLFHEMKQYVKVMLSVNQNELQVLGERAGIYNCTNTDQLASELFDTLGVHVLIVHLTNQSIGISRTQMEKAEGVFVKAPLVSTGGGDHFNGGFCIGLLLGLTLQESLFLGNIVASFYVSHGHSANYQELIAFIEQYK